MSLLAKFYNQIKISHEDIVSESLTYILEKSAVAKEVIATQIQSKTGSSIPTLHYHTQIVKENLGRTDISGIDSQGKEKVILEAKFWASLTENQPISYLKRLDNNGTLVFICPSLRKVSLYKELFRRIQSEKLPFEEFSNSFKLNNQYILIWSWTEILELIKAELKIHQETELLSDIDQLIGLCEVVDKNSFLPLTEKDLSPNIGKKVNSFYEIVDGVIAELSKNEQCNNEGLTQGGKKNRYYVYRNYYNYTISFGLNFEYWAKEADTPFFLKIEERNDKITNIHKGKYSQPEELKSKIKKLTLIIGKTILEDKKEGNFIPIYPKTEEDKDNVIKDMVAQINEIFTLLLHQ